MSGYRIWSIFYPALPLLLVVIVGWWHPNLWRKGFRRIERGWRRIAEQPLKAGLLIITVSLLLSAGLSTIVRWPAPVIADEFSYLLAADTFAAGRLTNPRHPFGEHFESLHIIQNPSYASKYQPAQGLLLAASRRIAGSPVFGLWASIALGCLAIYWMLLAWSRRQHALLGALLAAVHPIVLEWGQNFWGGGLPLLGGALTLGATGRICRSPRRRDGLILGVGLAILANCRPFEGAVLGLLCAALAGYALLRREIVTTPAHFLKVAIMPLLVLLPVVSMMGFYNKRVTGNPFRMPYLTHQQTYAIATPFIWQSLQPQPVYRHDSIRRFYLEYELESWRSVRSLSGFIKKGVIRKVGILLRSYLATMPMALVLIFALLWPFLRPITLWREKQLRRLWILFGCFLVMVLGETWLLPHYIAPAAGLIFLLAVESWRLVRVWKVGRKRTGLWLSRAVLLGSLLAVINLGFRLDRDQQRSWAWADERSRIEREMPADGNRHLLLVRYGLKHNVHQEWVYNGAEIDQAKVVWAREMDRESNQRLRSYYADRICHLVEIDDGPPTLKPCQ